MATMPDLALELAIVRLDAARAALAAARARLEMLPDDSFEALQAACALIHLKRAGPARAHWNGRIGHGLSSIGRCRLGANE
jgi:hypothetical protein